MASAGRNVGVYTLLRAGLMATAGRAAGSTAPRHDNRTSPLAHWTNDIATDMGRLTTHVLDTVHGCPAAGMTVALYRLEPDAIVRVTAVALNADGRPDGPLLEGAAFVPGRYRLVFGVADYFRGRGLLVGALPFLDEVPLEFGLSDATQHYHVPLLASPYAYSTYRGS